MLLRKNYMKTEEQSQVKQNTNISIELYSYNMIGIFANYQKNFLFLNETKAQASIWFH